MKEKYGDWIIHPGYMGFDFYHDCYDGAPDSGDRRCGNGDSIEDCRNQIDEMELDQ